MFKFYKFFALPLFFVVSAAHAASDGFYVGVNAGWAFARYGTDDFTNMTAAHIRSSGFAGGTFFGYQFSPMLGTELGYDRTSKNEITNITMGSNTPGGLTTLDKGNIVLNIWDWTLKGMLPLKHGFGLSAKAGIAFVRATVWGGLNNSALGSMYQNNSKILPELGIGVTYDINQNVSSGVDLTRIFQGGHIPNVDLAMINLAYHFG